jgi:hypothetical protein
VNPGVIITELQRRGGLDEEKYKNFLEHSKVFSQQYESTVQYVLKGQSHEKVGEMRVWGLCPN